MLEYYNWSTRLKALRCRLFGTTDIERWSDASSFEDWEERSQIIARLVPAGAKVIEFGVGTGKLRRHLDPSCSYTPSDLVSRGPGTIVLDLNQRPLPDLRHCAFDVAVFAGVLEYIRDLRSFLEWLRLQAPGCIASYGCAVHPRNSLARLSETFRRAGAGWTNTFTEPELIRLFADAGYGLVRAVDWHTAEGDERIFQFHVDDRYAERAPDR